MNIEKSKLEEMAKSIRISPQKKRILSMPKDLLIEHNALIFHKSSSLSSTERSMVQQRVAYGLNKGYMTTEEVAAGINKLNALVRGELVKKVKDDSTPSGI